MIAKELALGHRAIDFDHEVIANRLQAFIDKFPPDTLDQISEAQFLVELLIQHFRHELQIMRNANYTQKLEHGMRHSELLADWTQVLTEPSVEGLIRIQDDLYEHILTFDAELIRQLNLTENPSLTSTST